MGSRGRMCTLPELGCARADAPLHLPGGVSRVRTRLGNLAIQFEVRLPFVYRNPVFAANRCSLVGKFADERCDTTATHSAALHGCDMRLNQRQIHLADYCTLRASLSRATQRICQLHPMWLQATTLMTDAQAFHVAQQYHSSMTRV